MKIQKKEKFLAYIEGLPVEESTKKTYRNWINRIEKYCPVDLSSTTVRSEDDVIRIADLFPKDKFVQEHIKDIRCLVRYYLKFLIRYGVVEEQEDANAEGFFDPENPEDARKRVSRSIALRRGQKKFRDTLLRAYKRRCAFTGTDIEDILEAAHIKPFSMLGSNSPSNGILLRSDVHTLFDLCLISVNPRNLQIFCSSLIRSSMEYAQLHGRKIHLPLDKTLNPDVEALRSHYKQTKG